MAIALDTLAYARRLREAGSSERQAEGQAAALAATMTDTLATEQDLRELEIRTDARFSQVDARFDHLERHFDMRLGELEKRIEIRFTEQTASVQGQLGDLERRVTVRMLAGIAAVSALVKLL